MQIVNDAGVAAGARRKIAARGGHFRRTRSQGSCSKIAADFGRHYQGDDAVLGSTPRRRHDASSPVDLALHDRLRACGIRVASLLGATFATSCRLRKLPSSSGRDPYRESAREAKAI